MKRLMYVLFFVLLTSGMAYAQQAKYVFYFIGDGMGVNQVNGTEMYLAEQEGRIGVKPLLFTSFPVASMATTFSATNSVTDSSAAGTATPFFFPASIHFNSHAMFFPRTRMI